ncbi:unnamed protein product [Oncorhynchus mykiss]|uniref:Histone acetyltransferase type B catalytic subunit n=1 Tax=Oncorhynchus mykiss TaxID=8022 RepID=A0A060VS73_ONCMY|nr:unnamed protein product [Oncorhynchus mykiss]
MATEAREKLKINKKHARRVYEILRLRVTDMSVETKARDYRLEVKKRLFSPTKKNQRELTKMMRCLRPEELASHISQMDTALSQAPSLPSLRASRPTSSLLIITTASTASRSPAAVPTASGARANLNKPRGGRALSHTAQRALHTTLHSSSQAVAVWPL